MSPGNIAVNIDYDSGYVGERCQILADHGLLDERSDLDGVFYSTTEFGDRFARGELQPDDLLDEDE